MSKQLYKSVAEKIMSDILIAKLEPGTKLKSVREYAMEYKVNAKTIQRAFEYLDSLEIFYSVIGEGRFLAADNNVMKIIEQQLIDAEAEAFVLKMQSYQLSLADINQVIKESYERNN